MFRSEVSSSGIQAVLHLAQTLLFPSLKPPSTYPILTPGQGTWLSPGGGNFKIWGSISGQTSFLLNCLKTLCTKMRVPDLLFLPSCFIPASHPLLSITGGSVPVVSPAAQAALYLLDKPFALYLLHCSSLPAFLPFKFYTLPHMLTPVIHRELMECLVEPGVSPPIPLNKGLGLPLYSS